MTGIIYKAISGFYYVSCQNEIYECKARGNFRNAGISPIVGDKVEIEILSDGKGLVTSVLPRKNVLSRPAVANIDKLFIVSSFSTPAPDTLMIDRLTAIALHNDIEPIIVFNKCDLGDMSAISGIYKSSGFKTYIVSASEKTGIDELKQETQKSICAFSGNSGVGKSSIINSIFGELNLKTGSVSERLGRGRHTTRHTELLKTPFGTLVDTPGFAAIESESSLEFRDNLQNCFPEFSGLLGKCRFSTCTHTCEPGCTVIEAVNGGKIQQSRFESYITIFNELKDLKQWKK